MEKPRKDYTDHKFKHLTVLSCTGKQKNNGCYIWLAKCECGNITEVDTNAIKVEDKASCGCKRAKNWLGEEQNNFKVIARDKKSSNRQSRWIAQCKCGNVFTIRADTLTKKSQKGCGCDHEGKDGADNPAWRGGTTINTRKGKAHAKWVRSVLEEDNFSCQKCGCYGGNNKFNAHHLKSYSKHKDIRWEIDNGVTLCVNCHINFHKTYGYNDFTPENYFEYIKQEKIA